MSKISIAIAGIVALMTVSACSVEGVSGYQRAMNSGCVPLADGKIVCTGDRG